MYFYFFGLNQKSSKKVQGSVKMAKNYTVRLKVFKLVPPKGCTQTVKTFLTPLFIIFLTPFLRGRGSIQLIEQKCQSITNLIRYLLKLKCLFQIMVQNDAISTPVERSVANVDAMKNKSR